jgi:thioredoxin reductase/SAM-dependent methyltransferase
MTTNHAVNTPSPVDVLVVGGGAAGLSTALVLARSRRSVVLVDAGEQRNAPSAHMHNYLGREGLPPLELVRLGREEVESYGASVVQGRVVGAEAVPGDVPTFDVTLDDATRYRARRVVLATGVVDELPDVPGLAERWGADVLHCPYCHGWEVRDQRVGVLLTSAAGLHQAGLFGQLTDDLTVLTHGFPLDHGQREPLRARGQHVVDAVVAEVLAEDDRLVGVRLADDTVVPLDALVVASFPRARTDVADLLGVPSTSLDMNGAPMASALEADPMTGATPVPGVHAVGNAAAPMATVSAAAANGVQVGAFVNAQLVAEDTDAAVERARAAMREPAAWEERYGEASAVWSGRVNPQVPAKAEALEPGRAIDVGCGEGGDVIWLAQHGWDVTGMDFSPAGLERARQHAAEAGVADRTSFRVGDVRTWEPGDERWDLVTAHYVHLPPEPMLDVVRRLASAVAPGGTLLVVGHHPADVPAGPRHRDDLFEPDALLPALDPSWDVRTEVVERTHTGMGAHTVRDSVLVARRR